MRHSHCEVLSDAQVARIQRRRKETGRSSADLLQRFMDALKAIGCAHTLPSAKMRLDRVLNPRMRKPVSETTKVALAQALDLNLEQFENILVANAHLRSVVVRNAIKAAPPEKVPRKEAGLARIEGDLRRVASALHRNLEVLDSVARRLRAKSSANRQKRSDS